MKLDLNVITEYFNIFKTKNNFGCLNTRNVFV
jgi:hypothetical protein